MELAAGLLHYGGIMLCTALASVGVAYGQGIAGGHSTEALARQDLAQVPVRRSMLIGLAFLESGSVFSLVASLVFLFNNTFTPTFASGLAVFGAGLGMGLAACVVGIASGRVVAGAAEAMARQPFQANKIGSLMMLAQMLLEAPAVFAFILCFLVRSGLSESMTVAKGLQFGMGGILLGLSSIGPAIGQSLFSAAACRAVGTNIDMYPRIFSFAFVVQALIETPIIFALLLSLIIMMRSMDAVGIAELTSVIVGATLAFGIGSTGAAIGSGYVASRSVKKMVDQPAQYSLLLNTTIFCMAVIDTALIYSLIAAFFLVRRCI